MWFFMITCYVTSLLSFIMLGIALLQSYFHFHVFRANEVTFIILTSIVYLFTETLIMFFFVGTGVSIKEYTQAHRLKPDFHKKSLAIKFKVYPPQLLNILFMMVLFIMVGAVDTGRIPEWAYQLFFWFCLAHYIFIKKIQNQCFRDNTENILAMSGLKLGI